MREDYKPPAAGPGAAVDGASTRGVDGDAAPLALGPAVHAAGIAGNAQQAVGEPLHAHTSFKPLRQTARIDTVAVMREVYARPEPDGEMVGTYMRTAMDHGSYRAALEYYSGEECEKSDMPRRRLRVKGGPLGRLGHYDRVKRWLEEASAWRDFAHLLPAASVCVPRARLPLCG